MVYKKYWVSSNILEYGTLAESLLEAKKIQREMVNGGGTDAKIRVEIYEDNFLIGTRLCRE